MNVVTLLFVIVPGFVADAARRAWFGERKTSDFERTVHSLVFSVFGLGAYLTVAAFVHWWIPSTWAEKAFSPPYLAAVFGGSGGQPAVRVDAWLLVILGLHTLFATAVALGALRFLRSKDVSNWLQKHAGRSLDPAWTMLWARHYPVPKDGGERWITVISGGSRILGRFIGASDPTEAQDLILGDPLFWDEQRTQWRADGVRLVFIPAAKIDAIYLSPAGDESALRGYLDSEFRLLPEGGSP